MTDSKTAPATPLVRAVLSARCPQCESGPLYDGWIKFVPRCRACGLDYDRCNVGDGPAAFLILIVGGLVTAHALFLQLTAALVVLGLRLFKAALLILEYRNNAREGRMVLPPLPGCDA